MPGIHRKVFQRVCEQCRKDFLASHHEIVRGFAKYCSQQCYFASKRQALEGFFWARVKRTQACWTWTGRCDAEGYGLLKTHSFGKVAQRAHRISWILHFGLITDGMGILHRCDNPPCVRPDHLFMGSALDNALDAAAKGRTARGEKNHNAKLTAEQVKEMRRLAAGGVCFSELGRTFGVSGVMAARIVRRENWKHI